MEYNRKLYGKNKDGSYKYWEVTAKQYVCPIDNVVRVVVAVRHGKDGGKLQEKLDFYESGKQGRSALEQAVFEATSKYNKQVDKGYREDKEQLEDLPLLPMLSEDYLDVPHKAKFPGYASTKLDGVRCLAVCVERMGGTDVLLKSRGGKVYDLPHVKSKLLSTMEPGDVWDGEIYLHGYCLEEIASAVKRTDTQKEVDACNKRISKLKADATEEEVEKATSKLKAALHIAQLRPRLEFHIFDVVSDEVFEDRLDEVRVVTQIVIDKKADDFIKFVRYDKIECEEDLFDLHKEYVELGYEGIMYRNLHGLYTCGKRSGDSLKRKFFITSEFEIIDVRLDKDGRGVFVVWCPLAKTEFTVTCGDHASRQHQADNPDLFIGKFLTVQYQTRYKDSKLPQFPTGVAVRDYE